MGIGNQINGLYCFAMERGINFVSSIGVWHNRLGHLSNIVLYILKNDLKVGNSKVMGACYICHKYKQTDNHLPLPIIYLLRIFILFTVIFESLIRLQVILGLGIF